MEIFYSDHLCTYDIDQADQSMPTCIDMDKGGSLVIKESGTEDTRYGTVDPRDRYYS